jgi:hypothetical protein
MEQLAAVPFFTFEVGQTILSKMVSSSIGSSAQLMAEGFVYSLVGVLIVFFGGGEGGSLFFCICE